MYIDRRRSYFIVYIYVYGRDRQETWVIARIERRTKGEVIDSAAWIEAILTSSSLSHSLVAGRLRGQEETFQIAV